MKTKKPTFYLGIILMVLSLGAFCLGAGTFSATNGQYPDWMNTLGMYCFLGWLPLGIAGIILIKRGSNIQP